VQQAQDGGPESGYRGCGYEHHADSNGCAAGNTVAEAIVQGFLELIERDGIRDLVRTIDCSGRKSIWGSSMIPKSAI
jgi:YcaO cyclodehydratase, ATP-ad Mg2+-binding